MRRQPELIEEVSDPEVMAVGGRTEALGAKQVLFDADAAECIGLLETACHARPADDVKRLAGDVLVAKHNAAGRRRQHAAHYIDQRRLPRTVRADDAEHAARRYFERYALEDPQTAELLGRAFDAKRSCVRAHASFSLPFNFARARRSLRFSTSFRQVPTKPPGAAIMTTTSRTPYMPPDRWA